MMSIGNKKIEMTEDVAFLVLDCTLRKSLQQEPFSKKQESAVTTVAPMIDTSQVFIRSGHLGCFMGILMLL